MSRILQTPYIYSIDSYDPSFQKEVEFSYRDNQAVKNRAIIRNNKTNEIVYDKTQSIMKLLHVIPANTLSSGNEYLIQLQVFDSDGNSSLLSDPILFYCFSTPSFCFVGSETWNIYRSASITLHLNYHQNENEPLKNFEFLQYSADKTLLLSSGILYSHDIKEHTFYGLSNNTTYYYRAIGETIHGFALDTGFIKMNVVYRIVPANVAFQVENHFTKGYISLTSNILDIGYVTENNNYEIKDGMLILNNNSLTYNKGFTIEDDFALFVEAKKLPLKKFLTTNDNIFSLSIIEVCGIYYCSLNIKNSDFKQHISLPKARLCTDDDVYITTDSKKYIEIVDTNYDNNPFVVFEVKRISGIYNLKVYYKEDILA